MPSPFPGMDPWLEAPEIWPDLHEAFAAEIRRELNRQLPERYYARLEMRPEVGIFAQPPRPPLSPEDAAWTAKRLSLA